MNNQLHPPPPNASKSPMLECQSALPKLPLPTLEDTCEKYLRTVKPLLSPDEFQTTSAKVKHFLENEGKQFHQDLAQYRETQDSYIEEFWNDAYLKYNDSVVLNVNPIFILEDDPTPSRNSQIVRTSSLVLSSLKFIRAIRTQTLPPDTVRGTALCMSQYNALFGSARVPVFDKNHAYLYDEIITCKESTHIAVMSRGQIYYFHVIETDGTIMITQREIERNLKMIMEDSKSVNTPSKTALGILTTEDRDTWADIRTHLKSVSNKNVMSLEVLDKALYVLCLDDIRTQNVNEIAANMLHGTYEIDSTTDEQKGSCINRWYDKLQLIVTETGNAGVNFEHSAVDGHTVLRFASDVFTDTIIRFAQTVSGPRVKPFISEQQAKSSSTVRRVRSCVPRRLDFDIDHKLYRSIAVAEHRVSDRILQNEIQCLEFTGYGKQYIVRNNLSPDAFVQISIMAAYYLLYGKLVNTYESVQTKTYLHGRTEAARSASSDVLTYCESLVAEGVTDEEKYTNLQAAAATHCRITSEAAKGRGVDRHLFAMLKLYQKNHPKERVPDIFTDKAYSVLGDSILSTSNCGNPSLRFFGFGPVTPQGFGVGYIIKDDAIQYCVSSKNRQTSRYLTYLKNYLCQTQDMLLNVRPVWLPRSTFDGDELEDEKRDNGYNFFGDVDNSQVPIGNEIGTPLEVKNFVWDR